MILHAFPKNLQASNYFTSFADDLLSNAELKCKAGVPNSETQNGEVLVAVRGGDLVSLFEILQISVPVPVTMWRVPFVKSSCHTQGSRYQIASLLMRLNYLATAEGSRTNRLCNCTKFPT